MSELIRVRTTFEKNLERVSNLVQVYKIQTESRGQGRRDAKTLDVLRAAVVLLHGALEDLLRSIARVRIPASTNPRTFDGISLAQNSTGRKTSFGLADLLSHRGKQVDDVLRESVEEHLARSTYNDTTQIASLIKDMGLDEENHNTYFTVISKLIERRHLIVHRADRRENVRGSGHHRIQSISPKTVTTWADAVRNFGHQLLNDVETRTIQRT